MKAPLPTDEAERLQALERYRILDTGREQQFDDITRLAAQVCGAPIALISLVDRDRQWFKSAQGFEPAETSREASFCAHAILKPDDVLVVSDARSDARFADNPLVTAGGIRFYAGAPLVSPEGRALGTLCVLDRVPRTLETEQLAALRALRRMVMLELETRRQAQQLDASRADLEQRVRERTRDLHDSEERFRQLLEGTDTLVQSATPDGRIEFVNRAWLATLGYTEAEALAMRFDQVLHADCLESCRDIFDRVMRGERVRDVAAVFVAKDGRQILVEGNVSPRVADGQVAATQAFFRDVTERKRTQQELRRQSEALHQSEKLAAMGQLLAGVAHELNNPLAVVMGQSSLLRRAAGGTEQADRAEKIGRAAERCARIVKNFLALARQQPPERSRVAINQGVESVLELVSYPLRADGIEVKLELGAGLPFLWADDHQLQQVLINLLTNAHHALRESAPPRRVTVTTSFDPRAGNVVVEVADSGPGIPAELLPRIFDPFFTTKREGEGTGLGLSLCSAIVEAHGGSLRVESEPGRGAVFRILLPVETRPVAAAPARQADASPAAARSILVVDDEDGVRDVVADMLRLEGHRVETAGSGDEALEKTGKLSFDLVFSDLRMPGLDGPGLYRELVRRDPRMERRFVFMTGDTLTRNTREFLERTPATHLAKPFDQEELRTAVAEAVKRRSSGEGRGAAS
jgi:two-component system NtrC family sensor kinase